MEMAQREGRNFNKLKKKKQKHELDNRHAGTYLQSQHWEAVAGGS
jgi:hypothetical protein